MKIGETIRGAKPPRARPCMEEARELRTRGATSGGEDPREEGRPRCSDGLAAFSFLRASKGQDKTSPDLAGWAS